MANDLPPQIQVYEDTHGRTMLACKRCGIVLCLSQFLRGNGAPVNLRLFLEEIERFMSHHTHPLRRTDGA